MWYRVFKQIIITCGAVVNLHHYIMCVRACVRMCASVFCFAMRAICRNLWKILLAYPGQVPPGTLNLFSAPTFLQTLSPAWPPLSITLQRLPAISTLQLERSYWISYWLALALLCTRCLFKRPNCWSTLVTKPSIATHASEFVAMSSTISWEPQLGRSYVTNCRRLNVSCSTSSSASAQFGSGGELSRPNLCRQFRKQPWPISECAR